MNMYQRSDQCDLFCNWSFLIRFLDAKTSKICTKHSETYLPNTYISKIVSLYHHPYHPMHCIPKASAHKVANFSDVFYILGSAVLTRKHDERQVAFARIPAASGIAALKRCIKALAVPSLPLTQRRTWLCYVNYCFPCFFIFWIKSFFKHYDLTFLP